MEIASEVYGVAGRKSDRLEKQCIASRPFPSYYSPFLSLLSLMISTLKLRIQDEVFDF